MTDTVAYVNDHWDKPKSRAHGRPMFHSCSVSVAGTDTVRFSCSLQGYRWGDKVFDIGSFYELDCDLAAYRLKAFSNGSETVVGCYMDRDKSRFAVRHVDCQESLDRADPSCQVIWADVANDTKLDDNWVTMPARDAETAIRLARAVNHLSALVQQEIDNRRRTDTDPFAR
jgi:hypothetical protein